MSETVIDANTVIGDPELANIFGEEKVITPEDKLMMDAVDALDFVTPTPGNVMAATYIGSTANEILLDIGFKDYIRVEKKGDELKVAKNLEVGEEVKVAVLSVVDRPEFTIRGSIAAIAEREAKVSMKQKMKNNVPVNATIREMNPAGYILEVIESNTTLVGFMPNTLAGANKISNPSSIVGETMEVMIESYSRDKGTYILSRKRFLEGMIKGSIKELEVGEIDTPYVGKITGATNFGVFVEFNDCLTGMIHESNFNTDALEGLGIDSIENIPPGTQIEFYVKEVLKNNKIILTQNFRPSLWDTIKIDDVVEGTVRSSKPFGVLVKLDGETQGLIHSSELKKSNKKLDRGDKVKVKVISVQKSEKKIYLSIV
jgi:small subunit ribosomal protein S1